VEFSVSGEGVLELSELKTHEGETLELRFADGYAAIVRLLDVSEEHEDSDIVYDVLEVLNWGSVNPRTVVPKAVYTAASRDLVKVEFRPDYPNRSRPPA
jgi:hypothetical protein